MMKSAVRSKPRILATWEAKIPSMWGISKGGRVYQQTFVDTYSKVACAKLYTSKTPITAADLLNDKVLLLFAEQGLPHATYFNGSWGRVLWQSGKS